MHRSALSALLVVTVVLAGATAPVMAAPGIATQGGEGLGVEVTQNDDYTATVTVSENGTAVPGANVTVVALSGSYTGEGDYVTDANGTVVLPAPDEDVTVEVTAESEGDTANTTTTLLAPQLSVEMTQNEDYTATVNVSENGTPVPGANVTVTTLSGRYIGEGVYVTDASGTVVLPAPEENVTVEVTAESEGDTANTTTRLLAPQLSVEVTQNEDYTATVNVSENGTPVPGANVTVVALSGSYTGEGEYVTDAKGTVVLPAPEENVTVEVTAESEGDTANTTTTLVVPQLSVEVTQNEDYTATVAVSENGTPVPGANVSVDALSGSYTGEGDYVTDANGTVVLPAPDEDVTVEVTAESEGDTANTTTALLGPDEEQDNGTENFGQLLTDFMESLGDTDGPRGLVIADWVTSNNPGNAPDNAGPPDDVGPPDDAGPPDNIGPPADAGPPDDRGNDRCEDGNGYNDNNCEEDRDGE